jgi:hypothetical protein
MSTLEVSIYPNEVPAFVERELERLYESVYCTVFRFRVYQEAQGASTYVVRAGNAIVCVFLFRLHGNVVQVINQQIAIPEAELHRFSQAIFAAYRSARVISFYAIETEVGKLRYPFQKTVTLEENVVTLPSTTEAYTAGLSASMVKRLMPAQRKLKREFPDARYEVLTGPEVSEQVLREIIELAAARMASKHQHAYIPDADIDKILQLIHAYGATGVLIVDGKIRAGNVFYRVGSRYFMHIIAHDPAYDKYMLGNLVQYQTICHCIALRGRECYLMGGGRENKARFLAVPKYFESVDIYRSRIHFVLCWRRAGLHAARQWLHRARQHREQLAQEGRTAGRLEAACLALARRGTQCYRAIASAFK